jgi:hypothetical protein
MSVAAADKCRKLQIGAADKAVLLALADFAEPDGTRVFPSAQTVAIHTCLCRRTVLRCLGRLEAMGVLLLQGRRGCGRCNTNHYAIDLAKVAELIATGKPHKPEPTRQKKGDTASPFANGETDHFTTAEVQNHEATSQIKGDTESPFEARTEVVKGDSVSVKGDSVSPNPSSTVKEEESVCDVGVNPREEHTQAPPDSSETKAAPATQASNVVPFVPPGGRQPLPAGWVPSGEQMALARSLGLKAPEMTVLKFRDYWRRKGTARDEAGWCDAWEWWVRKDVRDQEIQPQTADDAAARDLLVGLRADGLLVGEFR